MKLLGWLLSILLHAGVAAAAAYLATPGTLNVDLGVPVYEVDLVKLEPAKKGAPKVAKTAEETKPPAKKVQPKKAKVVAKAPEKPVAKPVPKPAPKPAPKPEKKVAEISTKKEKPKPAPAPPKKKPEPKKPAKPEKTREQLLAEALKHAEKDVNWTEHLKEEAAEEKERKEREELEKELAALRESIAEEEAARAEQEEEEGAGGEAEEGSGSAGLIDIYRVVVRDTIKENWRYPDISAGGDLSARVEIELAADGGIVDYRIIESSGRPDFDTSTLAAVQATGSLPPPPRPDIKLIRITFNLQDMLK